MPSLRTLGADYAVCIESVLVAGEVHFRDPETPWACRPSPARALPGMHRRASSRRPSAELVFAELPRQYQCIQPRPPPLLRCAGPVLLLQFPQLFQLALGRGKRDRLPATTPSTGDGPVFASRAQALAGGPQRLLIEFDRPLNPPRPPVACSKSSACRSRALASSGHSSKIAGIIAYGGHGDFFSVGEGLCPFEPAWKPCAAPGRHARNTR